MDLLNRGSKAAITTYMFIRLQAAKVYFTLPTIFINCVKLIMIIITNYAFIHISTFQNKRAV